MKEKPTNRIVGGGKFIDPKAEAMKASMDVLREMANPNLIIPKRADIERVKSHELPGFLRRDSAIPYEYLSRSSGEAVKNWYDEDRLLRELFHGERGDTLIRAFKNFFPRISAGDFEKAWEHISFIGDQLPDMLAQIEFNSEFIGTLEVTKREKCAELFVECFRNVMDHYLGEHIAKLKAIAIDEELGSTVKKTNASPSEEQIFRINTSSKLKIENFFSEVDAFHEKYKDSVYTRMTVAQVDPRAVMPNVVEGQSDSIGFSR